MKRLILCMALLAVIPFRAFSQGLVLNTGDVFTFEFNNFHLESHLPPPQDPYTRILLGKRDFTGAFLFEVFEDNVTQPAVFSTDVIATVNPSTDFHLSPIWSDLQGVFRMTIESGSVTIPVLLGAVITSEGVVYSQSVTPVPEPTTWSLVVTLASSLFFLHWRRVKASLPNHALHLTAAR
jgi:hypothetical protein